MSDILIGGTFGANGLFPMVHSAEVEGGYHSVANKAARDAIPAARLQAGMVVYGLAEGVAWRLLDLTPTWSAIGGYYTRVCEGPVTAKTFVIVGTNDATSAWVASYPSLYIVGVAIQSGINGASVLTLEGMFGQEVEIVLDSATNVSAGDFAYLSTTLNGISGSPASGVLVGNVRRNATAGTTAFVSLSPFVTTPKYQTVAVNSTDRTQRAKLAFLSSFTVLDDAAGDRTTVAIANASIGNALLAAPTIDFADLPGGLGALTATLGSAFNSIPPTLRDTTNTGGVTGQTFVKASSTVDDAVSTLLATDDWLYRVGIAVTTAVDGGITAVYYGRGTTVQMVLDAAGGNAVRGALAYRSTTVNGAVTATDTGGECLGPFRRSTTAVSGTCYIGAP